MGGGGGCNPEIPYFPEDLSEFSLGINQESDDLVQVNYIIMWAKFYVYKNSTFQMANLISFSLYWN